MDFTTPQLFEMCAAAARHFMQDALPLGDTRQLPDDYVRQVSATTGLPHVMVRRNMQKIEGVLARMPEMLAGLTRNLDPELLDRGVGEAGGHALSFVPRGGGPRRGAAQQLAGRACPVGPGHRLEDGARAEARRRRALDALPHRPGLPEGGRAARGLRLLPDRSRGGRRGPAAAAGAGWSSATCRPPRAGRATRGSRSTAPATARSCSARTRPRSGRSTSTSWSTSILENSGRSCVNASGVWVTSHAREIAEALAERLAKVQPRAAEDPEAEIAPFAAAEGGRDASPPWWTRVWPSRAPST